jgi:hypothetical protein
MLIDINKKCSICKEFVSLNKDNVVWDKTYMHFDCLVEKTFNKKTNKLTLEEIKENVKKIQKDNENHIQTTLLREQFYRWLQQSYGVVSIPTYFFVKIDSVLTGEYKGLTISIPLDDLFDMWKRKKQELDKIALNNKNKGKDMDNVARLQYDLAILVGKYDSYLKWKQNNKLIEQEKKEVDINNKNKIDYSKVNKNENNVIKNDELNIMDFIDDI